MSTEPAETARASTDTRASADTRARLREALASTTARLGAAGVPSPSADARALLALATGSDGPLVLLDSLPDDFEPRLDALVARREAREPLQLIEGHAAFRRLRLKTEPGVFIPRPETELVLDLLQQHHHGPLQQMADLCTGSGALAAALLDELPEVRVLAVDIDQQAVALTRRNTAAWQERIEVRRADLTSPGSLAHAPQLDAVVANPPYVPPDAVPQEIEVQRYDPSRALYGGGADGLNLPRTVISWAHRLLRPGGLLIMEHADVQGAATRAAAERIGGFEDVATLPDLTGRDRFLVARRAVDATRPGPDAAQPEPDGPRK